MKMEGMRSISLFISTSADGKIARENGETDWIQLGPESGFKTFYEEVDTLLMGRVCFEKLLAKGPWPYSGKKTYVFSKNLRNHFGSDIEIVTRDPGAFVEDFKLTQGRKIWLVGGAEIAKTLMRENLVDEVVLNLHPNMLGAGVDLFPLPLHSMIWKLESSRELPDGLVQARYVLKDKV